MVVNQLFSAKSGVVREAGREGTQSLTDLLSSPLNSQSAGAVCSGKGSGENRMPQATHK